MSIGSSQALDTKINAPVAIATMPEPRQVADTTERINALQVVVPYALYIVITLFLFTPFVMTVLSSFKTSAEVIAFTPTLLPSVCHPENYLNVLTHIHRSPRMVSY